MYVPKFLYYKYINLFYYSRFSEYLRVDIKFNIKSQNVFKAIIRTHYMTERIAERNRLASLHINYIYI